MPSTLLFDHNFSSFYQIFLLLRLILLANLLTVHYDFDCHSSPSSRLVSANNQSTLSFLCAPKTWYQMKSFFQRGKPTPPVSNLVSFFGAFFSSFHLAIAAFPFNQSVWAMGSMACTQMDTLPAPIGQWERGHNVVVDDDDSGWRCAPGLDCRFALQ